MIFSLPVFVANTFFNLSHVNETQVTPGLGEPTLEYTHVEADRVEEEAAIQEDVGQVLDDVETEEMLEMEASKKAEGSFAGQVDTSLASKSREEEQVARQAEVRVGGAVEYLAEGRDGVLDILPLVEEVVDMDTAAEEEDQESGEEEASEQDEDEECEAEEGATSDQDHFEDDQDEDVEEDENVDEVEEEDGARRVVDVEQAEREMPPPGEHRFLPDSTTRRAMRSALSTFDTSNSNCSRCNVT